MTYDKNSFLAGIAVGRQLKGWGKTYYNVTPLGFKYCVNANDFIYGLKVDYSIGSQNAAVVDVQNIYTISDGEIVTLDSGYHSVTYTLNGGILFADVNVYRTGKTCFWGFAHGTTPAQRIKFPMKGIYTYSPTDLGCFVNIGNTPIRYFNSGSITINNAAQSVGPTLWRTWYNGQTITRKDMYMLPIFTYKPLP